ncbi:MAG: DNA repair protein RadA [Acidimicrobiales bacterium]
MTRPKSLHRCQACGQVTSRWSGRCPACGEWNTLVEEVVPPPTLGEGSRGLTSLSRPSVCGPSEAPLPLQTISPDGAVAVATGIGELDRVLGGGLVAGSVTVLGGEPGVGKSTLVLQALASAAGQGRTSLLIAAEESGEQVRRRAGRLQAAVDGCYVLATTDLDAVIGAAGQLEPSMLVVDSIQAVSDRACPSQAGSPSQVRECAGRLVRYAKTLGVATVLVGHVTKDGGLAGPRTLEHLVDTVLSFEGDRHHSLRLLSASKHRYGPTGEIGLFEMTEAGLQGLVDPSALLLGDRRRGVPGSIAVPVLEGRRPLIIEIQGLVGPPMSGAPRRVAQGVVGGRLALLLAVLERRCHVAVAASDVFVSTVGGLRVNEPAADLGVALALVSAVTAIAIGEDVVALGEVGLAGEIRQVPSTERRLAEAVRLGFRRAVVPQSCPEGPVALELLRAGTLLEAVRLLLGVVPAARSGPRTGSGGGPELSSGRDVRTLERTPPSLVS